MVSKPSRGSIRRLEAVVPPYRTGLNSVCLHLGHLPALSNGTALVKCFTYWHALHLQRIERSSGDGPI